MSDQRKPSPAGTLPDEWVETEATVTSCRFQFARMNTLTLGVQRGEKFRIMFDYYAHGRLYTGEFQSAVAIAQNERIRVSYDPHDPQRNSLSRRDADTSRMPLLAFGVAGSVVLSLAWLLILRGCQ